MSARPSSVQIDTSTGTKQGPILTYAGLPCLSSHNCTKHTTNPPQTKGKIREAPNGEAGQFGGARDKIAIAPRQATVLPSKRRFTGKGVMAIFTLRGQVMDFFKYFGRDFCALMTITADENLHPREFAKRFHSWRTNEAKWFRGYIRVLGPQKCGAPHFHLLVATHWNMLPGQFRWDALNQTVQLQRKGERGSEAFNEARQAYVQSSAPETVAVWKQMRDSLPNYGLGRAEFLPIRTTADAIARYLSRHLEDSFMNWPASWKGSRRVDRDRKSSKLWNRHHSQIASVSRGAAAWRKRVGEFAAVVGITDFNEFKERFGPRWAWQLRAQIIEATKAEWQEYLILLAEQIQSNGRSDAEVAQSIRKVWQEIDEVQRASFETRKSK